MGVFVCIACLAYLDVINVRSIARRTSQGGSLGETMFCHKVLMLSGFKSLREDSFVGS